VQLEGMTPFPVPMFKLLKHFFHSKDEPRKKVSSDIDLSTSLVVHNLGAEMSGGGREGGKGRCLPMLSHMEL
jgi:hypothetical protein